jgi:hypothetical protein
VTYSLLLRCIAISWFLIGCSLWDKDHGIGAFFIILAVGLWCSLPRTPSRRKKR